MGSKKLLLKQKEIAEAFASGRDVFVSFVSQFQFFSSKKNPSRFFRKGSGYETTYTDGLSA